MKYYNADLSEQETIINVLYKEGIISIYSSRPDVIHNLTETLGQPNEKIRRNRTSWSGARWNLEFDEISKIKKVISKENFIDENFRYKKSNKNKNNDLFYQLDLLNSIENDLIKDKGDIKNAK